MSEPRGERPTMPDYGVDTPDWEALPWSWAAAKLAGNRNFWVATASTAGRPHAMPVWGVWDDTEHRFAFSCGPHSRKVANLAANPQVAFTVDDTVECLSVEGRAERVEGQRAEKWITRLLDKYRPVAPDLTPEFYRQHAMLEVIAERAFAVIERDVEFTTRATRWRFGQAGQGPG